jgi:hypothetical protein
MKWGETFSEKMTVFLLVVRERLREAPSVHAQRASVSLSTVVSHDSEICSIRPWRQNCRCRFQDLSQDLLRWLIKQWILKWEWKDLQVVQWTYLKNRILYCFLVWSYARLSKSWLEIKNWFLQITNYRLETKPTGLKSWSRSETTRLNFSFQIINY